jgi:hypothetical protein
LRIHFLRKYQNQKSNQCTCYFHSFHLSGANVMYMCCDNVIFLGKIFLSRTSKTFAKSTVASQIHQLYFLCLFPCFDIT